MIMFKDIFKREVTPIDIVIEDHLTDTKVVKRTINGSDYTYLIKMDAEAVAFHELDAKRRHHNRKQNYAVIGYDDVDEVYWRNHHAG
jgi:hypothetical protein